MTANWLRLASVRADIGAYRPTSEQRCSGRRILMWTSALTSFEWRLRLRSARIVDAIGDASGYKSDEVRSNGRLANKFPTNYLRAKKLAGAIAGRRSILWRPPLTRPA
jgi:hypothetical protein